jgi:hypothetical protein
METIVKLARGWRRQLAAEPRWTRQSLAELWGKSERQVDRMRRAGLLGEPVGRIGKTDIYSDEQRLAAERAGLRRRAEPAPQNPDEIEIR